MLGQQLLRAVVRPQPKNMLAKRSIYTQMSGVVLSGVPRNRIPFAEKVATGVFIAVGILATPAWILTHMDDYRTLEAK